MCSRLHCLLESIREVSPLASLVEQRLPWYFLIRPVNYRARTPLKGQKGRYPIIMWYVQIASRDRGTISRPDHRQLVTRDNLISFKMIFLDVSTGGSAALRAFLPLYSVHTDITYHAISWTWARVERPLCTPCLCCHHWSKQIGEKTGTEVGNHAGAERCKAPTSEKRPLSVSPCAR